MSRYQPVPDYHMHTPRCHHAEGEVADYARAAIAAGLEEIGMSDHSPMPPGFEDDWRMAMDELDDYRREVARARETFAGRLTIRLGLEADYRPGSEEAVAAMIAAHNWDYVIGSVHYIEGWDFDNPDKLREWDGRNIEDAWCDYFALVGQSARTGLFDIIGHPDLIKKFGHKPPADSVRVAAAMEAMLEDVRDAGCALEISSAGLRKPVGEIYPHPRMIARAAELGIPFAYGSDAHKPEDVGHAMDACLAMLESAGIHEICIFEGRHRSLRPIRQA